MTQLLIEIRDLLMYQLVSVINQYGPIPEIKTSAYILSDICSYKNLLFRDYAKSDAPGNLSLFSY